MSDDFLPRLRELLREHAHVDDCALGTVEAALRAEFGAQRVYIRRAAKRDRLAALESLPAEMPQVRAAEAIGVSIRHMYRLRRLARD